MTHSKVPPLPIPRYCYGPTRGLKSSVKDVDETVESHCGVCNMDSLSLTSLLLVVGLYHTLAVTKLESRVSFGFFL